LTISKNKSELILLLTLLFTMRAYPAVSDDLGQVQVHLLRKVTVDNSVVMLGDIAIVRGSTSAVEKISGITLGRFSLPTQKLTIENEVIKSRLTCSGFPYKKVKFTGAKTTVVSQKSNLVSTNQLLLAASDFLKSKIASTQTCKWNALRQPTEIAIPSEANDISLVCEMTTPEPKDYARIKVSVIADGIKGKSRSIPFSLKYRQQKAIAVTDIPAGSQLSRENIKLEKIWSDKPGRNEFSAPYGLVTEYSIRKGSSIEPHMVARPKPELVIDRNDIITVKIEYPGLLITATAKALQKGRVGDLIRVRNIDSQRIFVAKVKQDGTVTPSY